MEEPTYPGYQPVIGLEIHVQLNTRSKVFATEDFVFGGPPNAYVSPISLAHPGALPSLNQACIEQTIKLGLATHCEIDRYCYFARKNYFYPDLPKGYQLSQDQRPLCTDGYLDVPQADGQLRRVTLERIHLEEDAGKSIHDLDPVDSLIDLNRAGTGLAEVVTRPDLRSAAEAGALLAEMRRLVRYLEVSDANMEEGNLRCDANVSVMPTGATQYGTRVEIKNLNSISNLIRAVTYEIGRQIDLLESGQAVVQETRTWDPATQQTLPMRDKEMAADYRYFPEPDLLPLHLSADLLHDLGAGLPELPTARFQRYVAAGIAINEAFTLIEQRAFSDYFEALQARVGDPKAAANWLLGPVRSHLNATGEDIAGFPVAPAALAALMALVDQGQVSLPAAREQVFPALVAAPATSPLALAQQLGVMLESQASALAEAMDALMAAHPDEVARFQAGKKQLQGFFVGQLMRQFRGKADPQEVNAVVRQKLQP